MLDDKAAKPGPNRFAVHAQPLDGRNLTRSRERSMHEIEGVFPRDSAQDVLLVKGDSGQGP